MSTTGTDPALEARRKYVAAFNDTMVKIWREKIILLGVFDTGALYNSVAGVGLRTDGSFTSIEMEQEFLRYGLYQEMGVGHGYLGNPGDVAYGGKHGTGVALRDKRRWFSVKYMASFYNLRDFMAENLGSQFTSIVGNALSRAFYGRFL